MKKIIAMLLVLAMALPLVACGGAAKEEKVTLNVIAAQYGTKTADWWKGFDNKHSEAKMAAISDFFDFFYEDKRYSDWVIMEDFLPATKAGGEFMAAADPDNAAWIEIVGSANFYPAAKAEWADVKQGVIDVQQKVLLGGDTQALLDALQAGIAG